MSTFLNRCCVNNCNLGAVIPRYQNITMCRPVGDPLGPHYDVPPYVRFSANSQEFTCTDTDPKGTCGGWLVGPGPGVSAQVIDDTVNDIMTCAGGVVSNDHNCYSQNGTVDMTVKKLFGAQWINAMKQMHGTTGWLCDDECPAPNPNNAPTQTLYRTVRYQVNYSVVIYTEDSDHHPTVLSGTKTGSIDVTISVNRLTGVLSLLGYTVKESFVSGGTTTMDITNGAGLWTDLLTYTYGLSSEGDGLVGADYHCGKLPTMPSGNAFFDAGGFSTFDDLIDTWNAFATDTLPLPSATPNSYSQSKSKTVTAGGNETVAMSLEFSRTNTNFTWAASYDDTHDATESGSENENIRIVTTFSGSAILSDALTLQDYFQDYLSAIKAWNTTDFTLASLRTDEQLANAPLCIYNELAGTSPITGFVPATMTDFGSGLVNDKNGNVPGSTAATPGQHDNFGDAPGSPYFDTPVDYITTWAQAAWHDSRDLLWTFPNGSIVQPAGYTTGATLKTGWYDGTMLAHNPAGSDRHFWFGYQKVERDLQPDPANYYEWFDNSTGGFSDPNLPAVALRWLDNDAAQYDGAAFRNSVPAHPGNYRQGWYNQSGRTITGGKFIRAVQKWPALNIGRPCGPDKYAADQTTVCAVVTSGGGTFSVKTTGNAIAPLAAGGIAVNDYIIVAGDGIYKVTSITDDGTQTSGDNSWHQWTLHVGAQIDVVPTGYNIGTTTSNDLTDDPDETVYLGKLRFPNAPGICGRVAVVATFATGTITLTPAIAQPNLKIDPTSGIISVDLYDASMNLLTQHVSLTRNSDTNFSFAAGALLPNIAYMVANNVDWTKSSTASQYTGVNLMWSFNLRQAAAGFVAPPTFYGGAAGCTGCFETQFNYVPSACAPLVGIIPTISPESSPTAIFYNLPDAPTLDLAFGAIGLQEVAMTMPDPFWQPPFKPDGGTFSPDSLAWLEDDGSGQMDFTTVTEGGATHTTKYYAHHPLVEALSIVPGGVILPAGVSLMYDLTVNAVAPPFYPNGIPIGDDTGGYASVETDWGFATRACQTGNRFAPVYLQFVTC